MATAESRMGTIRWWEVRRPLFNLMLVATSAAAGALLFAVLPLFFSPNDTASPANWVFPPLYGTIILYVLYLMAANFFYTFGWVSELLWSGGEPARIADRRSAVFRAGMIFSFVVTLSPAVVLPLLLLAFG